MSIAVGPMTVRVLTCMNASCCVGSTFNVNQRGNPILDSLRRGIGCADEGGRRAGWRCSARSQGVRRSNKRALAPAGFYARVLCLYSSVNTMLLFCLAQGLLLQENKPFRVFHVAVPESLHTEHAAMAVTQTPLEIIRCTWEPEGSKTSVLSTAVRLALIVFPQLELVRNRDILAPIFAHLLTLT